ncbi:hypothetical protein GF373_14405 [bacterium]|nr:hypothetical protein [bacterium]
MSRWFGKPLEPGNFPAYDLLPWKKPMDRVPWWSWFGLAVIIISQLLLIPQVEPIYTHFTLIVWWGLILFLDGLIRKRRGVSFLPDRPVLFLFLAIVSLFWWLVFEFYNCYLENWVYIGIPENLYHRYICYGLSFATITPAILLTYEFFLTYWPLQGKHASSQPRKWTLWTWFLFGAVCVALPLLIPQREIRHYLFGFVWVGFVFLLEPVLYWAGGYSLLRLWANGYKRLVWLMFAAGIVCGLLWEFWNFWAGAKWLYVVPLANLQGIPFYSEYGGMLRYFEMPLLGFLGFLPFAWECLVLSYFSALILNQTNLLPHFQPPAEKTVWSARCLFIVLLLLFGLTYVIQDERYFPIRHLHFQTQTAQGRELKLPTTKIHQKKKSLISDLNRLPWEPALAQMDNFAILGLLQRSKSPAVREAADDAIRAYAVQARFNWANQQ